jgi:hypothetical protein
MAKHRMSKKGGRDVITGLAGGGSRRKKKARQAASAKAPRRAESSRGRYPNGEDLVDDIRRAVQRASKEPDCREAHLTLRSKQADLHAYGFWAEVPRSVWKAADKLLDAAIGRVEKRCGVYKRR